MNLQVSNLLPEPYMYSLGYIILYLPPLDIAPKIDLDGETLFAKDRFHMSIFGVKEYINILSDKLKISSDEAENKILEESAKILVSNHVKFVRFKDELRLAQEADKKTVAIMCEADGLENFFDKLQDALKIEISTQPVHSTIYTRKDGRGIGMINQKELTQYSRPLTYEEIKIVSEHFVKAPDYISIANSLDKNKNKLDITRRRVSVILFYDQKGRILLQGRSGKVSKVGEEWGLFGGGIEEGETPEQAIKREIKEELNYDLKQFTHIGEYENLFYHPKQIALRKIHKTIFIAPLNDEIKNSKVIEGDTSKVFTTEEAKQLKLVPGDEDVIEIFESYWEKAHK